MSELEPYEKPTIEGVPDWALAFLDELRDNPAHFGAISHAAKAVGHTWHGVAYWRDKNPDFAAELLRTRNDVLEAIIDELEHLALRFAVDGIGETAEERFTPEPDDDGYRYVKKTKLTWDIKHIQWLLERLHRQRYGADPTGLATTGKVQFVFKLGDNDEVAGQVETETVPLALPPGQAD